MKEDTKKIYLRTFGCQMNMHDSEAMAGILRAHGYEFAEREQDADIVLLNTCSVRRHAEERVISKVGQIVKRSKSGNGVLIGICGCMAQRIGEGVEKMPPGVRLVSGTGALQRLPENLDRLLCGKEQTVVDTAPMTDESSHVCPGFSTFKRLSSLTAWVAVMRGCDNYCSYCVVPYVRGREMSRSSEEILAEIQGLVSRGCREVTLLGQNVNSYGRGLDEDVDFPELLAMINDIDGLARIRFITSHPKDMSRALIRAFSSLDTVCEYLHLPLQSGSDRILRAMNRGYTARDYLRLIEDLRSEAPGIGLSTDIIAGFPGETDEDFQKTCGLLSEIRFDSAFLFKYSDRSETAAAEIRSKVPQKVIRERHTRLLGLQQEISLGRYRECIGTQCEVLVEGTSKRNEKRLFGRTRTNKIAVFEGGKELTGQTVKLDVIEATSTTLYGKMK